jgi:hypothetical protein
VLLTGMLKVEKTNVIVQKKKTPNAVVVKQVTMLSVNINGGSGRCHSKESRGLCIE